MSGEKIVRLIRTEGKTRVFEMDDGSVVERTQGTAAWRHNNPGNLKLDYKGSKDPSGRARRTKEVVLADARKNYDGVVDLDQWGNVIFETYEAGRAAQIKLLTGKYREQTVEKMLSGYSAADYSGPTHHANQLAAIYRTADQQGVDLRNKTIESMTPTELTALADGIAHFEGWQVGGTREIQAATRDALAHQHTTAAPNRVVPDASTSHVAPAAAHTEVGTLQQNLAHLGYTDAQGHPLIADNHDGPRTRHAIETFQRQLGLPVTGLANQETLMATQVAMSMANAQRDVAQRSGLSRDVLSHIPAAPAPTQANTHASVTASRTSHAPVIEPAASPDHAVATLQLGDASPAVLALQQQLNHLGYTDEHGRPLQADHHFGPRTHAVVQAFQRDHGLQDDGKVGPYTLATLEHANQQWQAPTQDTARASKAATPTAHAPALDANAVRTMQTQLHTLGITDMHQQPVAVSGIYDPSTQAAVARFQAEQGMPVTGHADDATRAALQSRAFIADLQQLSESSPSIRAQRDTHLLREEHAPNQVAPTLSPSAQTPAREDSSAPTLTRSASDPRVIHAGHYADLKQRFPELSEEHLVAATVAIHKAGIPPNKPLYEADMLTNGTLRMLTESPMYGIVRVDMKATPPSIEQSSTQVQTYDAHHAQIAQNQQQQMAHGQHGR